MNGACTRHEALRHPSDNDLLPQEWSKWESHVTSCASCRAALDELAADDDWRQQVRHALSGDKAAQSWGGSNGDGNEDGHPDGDGSLRHLPALLGPTDDPRMLGRIGPYEVTGILGQGGMGVVFKACDAALNRYVAIKMLLPHLATSGAARKRFAREAQAAAAVVNDFVMAIHSVAEWQGMPYLVMSYAPGVSLQKRLDEEGPLRVAEILRIGMQAATGLAAAHAQGLVHRDVKPANILLADGVERVTLTDFGLARAVDDVSLTRVGVLAGTPPYMSPEQARGQAIDARSDLFSLGSVLYAMCTGRTPFRADSSYGVLRLVIDTEPCPIREINPEIPEWLSAVVNKLMAKRPDDRFATAAEVAELFQNCLAHLQQPTTVPLPSFLPRTFNKRRTAARPFIWVAVALVLGIVPAAVVYQSLRSPGGPQDGTGQSERANADEKKRDPNVDAKGGAPPALPPVPKKELARTPEQERAIAILRRLNVKFKFDAPGQPVVHVSFEPGTDVDDILKDLLPLTEIGVLGLQGTHITDAGLKHVAGFKLLHQLYLGQTAVSDAGLRELVGLDRLTHLGLENTRVTDAGVKTISAMKTLNYLNIGSTSITDSCLKDVAGLPNLGMLCIYSTDVTDDGMKDLKGLTNLRTLLINKTAISDAGLKELAPLTQLKKINVQNSKVTDSGLKALQQTAPSVRVEGGTDADPGTQPKRGHAWASAAVAIAVVAALFVAVVVRLIRKRRHGGEPSAPVDRLLPTTAPVVALPPIGLQCGRCGRKIRAAADQAGKAAKCPGCGTLLDVPNAKGGPPAKSASGGA
jgi:serine/threonine protein kinase